jgi:hypothetical protein
MLLKKRLLVFLLSSIFLIGIVISCRKEILDENITRDFDIMEARNWFENLSSPELVLESKDFSKNKLDAKPNWNLAFKSRHGDSETIEVPLILTGEFGYSSEESYQAFKESGDKRLLISRTTMIIEKKENTTIGFLMTIIPDKECQIVNNFDVFNSSYKKWQKDFGGVVLYHRFDGSFVNGWRFVTGKVVSNIY